MTEFEIKHGLSQDAPGPLEPVELAASPVSTLGQGEAVAWMDPTTLDVISAERKASWLSDYGAGGAVKAATYTRALGDLRPAPAAGDARDAARYRWLRNEVLVDGEVNDSLYVHVDSPEWPTRWALVGDELDTALDAAIAAQRQGDA